MKHPVKRLQNELSAILRLLDGHAFFTLTKEDRFLLRQKIEDLLLKAAAIEESFLTVGLMGGTGVGKSTLMNALAEAEIATASHRRPHTDHILIYRHEDAPSLAGLDLMEVPWQEITHHSDPVQQILLCDLPDIDSFKVEHRAHVLHFLEHLDVLVWITSPEKYADGRFYEFLRDVPKASQNFYFVLNKMDLFFSGVPRGKGYEALVEVMSSFQRHIKSSGIPEPIVYAVSAEKAMDSPQWEAADQFSALRQHVFQERDIKQVRAIKTANMDVEVQRLRSSFRRELRNLQEFETFLESAIKDLKGQRGQWIEAGRQIIDRWADPKMKARILAQIDDPSLLVGPGRMVAMIFTLLRGRFNGAGEKREGVSSFAASEDVASSFEEKLQWIEDRIKNRMLRLDLPASFVKRLQEIVDTRHMFDLLGEQFLGAFEAVLSESRKRSFWIFRLYQHTLYFLLLAVFLFALGGETAWRGFFEMPGWSRGMELLLALVRTIFSDKGLAALLSYGLINLILSWRFYRICERRLERTSDRLMTALKNTLQRTWGKGLDSILAALEGLKGEISDGVSALSNLDGKDLAP